MNVSIPTQIYRGLSCDICREEYRKNSFNECLLLNCGHLFHEKCVKPWLIKHDACPIPICRAKNFVYLSPKELLIQATIQGLNRATDAARILCKIMFALLVQKGIFHLIGEHPIDETIKECIEPINNEGRLIMKGIITLGIPLGVGLISARRFLAKKIGQPITTKTINYSPRSHD